MPVRVQQEDFDISAEIAALRAGRPSVGAVASFIAGQITTTSPLPMALMMTVFSLAAWFTLERGKRAR